MTRWYTIQVVWASGRSQAFTTDSPEKADSYIVSFRRMAHVWPSLMPCILVTTHEQEPAAHIAQRQAWERYLQENNT